jgi:hypothetical protein
MENYVIYKLPLKSQKQSFNHFRPVVVVMQYVENRGFICEKVGALRGGPEVGPSTYNQAVATPLFPPNPECTVSGNGAVHVIMPILAKALLSLGQASLKKGHLRGWVGFSRLEYYRCCSFVVGDKQEAAAS